MTCRKTISSPTGPPGARDIPENECLSHKIRYEYKQPVPSTLHKTKHFHPHLIVMTTCDSSDPRFTDEESEGQRGGGRGI